MLISYYLESATWKKSKPLVFSPAELLWTCYWACLRKVELNYISTELKIYVRKDGKDRITGTWFTLTPHATKINLTNCTKEQFYRHWTSATKGEWLLSDKKHMEWALCFLHPTNLSNFLGHSTGRGPRAEPSVFQSWGDRTGNKGGQK